MDVVCVCQHERFQPKTESKQKQEETKRSKQNMKKKSRQKVFHFSEMKQRPKSVRRRVASEAGGEKTTKVIGTKRADLNNNKNSCD